MADDPPNDRASASMTAMSCDSCHASVPGYDVIHVGSIETGYGDLCSRCFNQQIASLGDSGFEHVSFGPIDIPGAAGARHIFHFLLRHLGDTVSLEAFEVAQGKRAGYQFQIVDAAEVDLFDLMRRLIERMRRTVATRQLEEDGGSFLVRGMSVGGRIDCDLDVSPSMPILVIDGKDVAWDEFGRMIMAFEGWQFNLAFLDPSDELPPSAAIPTSA